MSSEEERLQVLVGTEPLKDQAVGINLRPLQVIMADESISVYMDWTEPPDSALTPKDKPSRDLLDRSAELP